MPKQLSMQPIRTHWVIQQRCMSVMESSTNPIRGKRRVIVRCLWGLGAFSGLVMVLCCGFVYRDVKSRVDKFNEAEERESRWTYHRWKNGTHERSVALPFNGTYMRVDIVDDTGSQVLGLGRLDPTFSRFDITVEGKYSAKTLLDYPGAAWFSINARWSRELDPWDESKHGRHNPR